MKGSYSLVVGIIPIMVRDLVLPARHSPIESDGEDVGIKQRVMCRAQQESVGGVHPLRNESLTPRDNVSRLESVSQRQAAEGATSAVCEQKRETKNNLCVPTVADAAVDHRGFVGIRDEAFCQLLGC